MDILVVALQSCWLVAAPSLALFRTVVLAVLVWSLLVERVAASNLGALFLELGLSGFRLGECVVMLI